MLKSDHWYLRQEKLFSGVWVPQYRLISKLTIASHFASDVRCSIN